jgi:hypothetical protein
MIAAGHHRLEPRAANSIAYALVIGRHNRARDIPRGQRALGHV